MGQQSKTLQCSARGVAVLEASAQVAHNWSSVIQVWAAGMSLSHRPLETPCGRQGTCTLTRLHVVRCFLRHIGAAGFGVKRAVCQQAERLGGGRISEDAWLLTIASAESVQELQRWDKTVTTNWGEKGIKSQIKYIKYIYCFILSFL